MSRKAIKRLEKFYLNENVKGFEKDSESGFYRIVEQKITRETESNTINSSPLSKSEDLYMICEKHDAEKSYRYQNFEGEESIIFFKKMTA